MTRTAAQRREVMHQLRQDLEGWQGYQCAMPWCTNPWSDPAHIDGSGMGGRPSTYNIENMAGLCRSCHDTFDGRDLAGRQYMLRQLLAAHVKVSRDAVTRRRLREAAFPTADLGKLRPPFRNDF